MYVEFDYIKQLIGRSKNIYLIVLVIWYCRKQLNVQHSARPYKQLSTKIQNKPGKKIQRSMKMDVKRLPEEWVLVLVCINGERFSTYMPHGSYKREAIFGGGWELSRTFSNSTREGWIYSRTNVWLVSEIRPYEVMKNTHETMGILSATSSI